MRHRYIPWWIYLDVGCVISKLRLIGDDNFCRYMIASDKDTMYVSFMGTKQRRDLAANAAVLQEPLWPDMTGSQVYFQNLYK